MGIGDLLRKCFQGELIREWGSKMEGEESLTGCDPRGGP